MLDKQKDKFIFATVKTRTAFFTIILAAIICFAANSLNASPSAGELDSSLNAAIDFAPGTVRSTVLQPDGKILVGGFFKSANGVRSKSILRLSADFSVDTTFNANVSGAIFAIALQPDGKIVIGGDSVSSVEGVNRGLIARLNSDGSTDTTFNPGMGADGIVNDVVVQPDGKILLGGNFYGVNSKANYGIARLNADGSADISFNSPLPPPIPSPNPPIVAPSIVYSIALQTDGKIVIGGFIVTNTSPTTFTTTAVARLNANGSFDSSFTARVNSNALKVVVQPDGKILLTGFFNNVNGVSRNYIVRLNADGSTDASFNLGIGPNLPVYAIFLKADGKILIGGIFFDVNGAERGGLALLNADGSLDPTFAPKRGSVLGTVNSVIPVSGGKVLAGGSFTRISGGANLALFNPDGSVDSSFNFTTTALGGVRVIAVQTDGKIIIGGTFNRVNGVSRRFLARLNADGSLDPAFNTDSIVGSPVTALLLQPDGKILVGGSFGFGSGVFPNIIRLNADGTLDTTFTQGNVPGIRSINSIALQTDGKIVIVWGAFLPNRMPTGGVARLNINGSVDTSFSSQISTLFFNSVAIQSDGKILVGGQFSFGYVSSRTGSVNYNGLIRLNTDGSHDTAFVPATVSEGDKFTTVFALALQADGKILVGGRIFVGNSATPVGLARLNFDGTLDTTFDSGAISVTAGTARVEDVLLLPDGKILIGGLFSDIGANLQTSSVNIARLNADGSPDNSFSASTDNVVYDIAVQADGKVLIGGDFETVNGAVRSSFARLLSEPITAPRRRAARRLILAAAGKLPFPYFDLSKGYGI